MHIHGIVRGDNIMPTQVIDLFCGIGGLTRGLLDAGLNVIAGFDNDPTCEFAYDERFLALKQFIKDELKYIQGKWTDLRNESGEEKARELLPAIDSWFKSLSADNRKYAKKMFGKIKLSKIYLIVFCGCWILTPLNSAHSSISSKSPYHTVFRPFLSIISFIVSAI